MSKATEELKDEQSEQDQELDSLFDDMVDGEHKETDEPENEEEGLGEEAKEKGEGLSEENAGGESSVWDNAPEELRAEYKAQQERLKQTEHKAQSTAGRVSAFQKRINELEQALSKQQAVAVQQPAPSSTAQQQEATPSDDDLSELAEDYPKEAAFIRSVRAAQAQTAQQLEQMQQQHQQLLEAEQQRGLQQETAALEAAHPDVWDVVQSDEYTNWLQEQPDAVRTLARDSNSASDAIWLLNNFKGSQKPDTSGADHVNISGVRQQRRQSAVSISGKRGARSPSGPGTDEAALFDHFAGRSQR